MRIFIDDNYMCHVENDSSHSLRAFDVPFFDGKCVTFVESYRFVPSGESWTSKNGKVFPGEMASAAYDFEVVQKAQQQYEAGMAVRFSELGISQEQDFTATRNYPVNAFIGIYGQLYEVIRSIPQYTSIVTGQNVIKTTVEHYLDTLKEEK